MKNIQRQVCKYTKPHGKPYTDIIALLPLYKGEGAIIKQNNRFV